MYGTVEDPPTLPAQPPEPSPPAARWVPLEGMSLLRSTQQRGLSSLDMHLQVVIMGITTFCILIVFIMVARGAPLPVPIPGLTQHHHHRRPHHHHSVVLPDIEQPLPLAPELSQAELQTMFIGAQVRTRQTFGFGTYVFEAMVNTHQEMVVTSLASAAPRPSPSERKASSLWRWSECNWAFVPGSTAPQRERVDCSGAFPTARCKTVRTDGTNVDPLLATAPVEGRYTDDVIARSIGADVARRYSSHATPPRTWQQLVQSTGKGGLFHYGEEWPLPAGLCYQEIMEPPPPQPADAPDDGSAPPRGPIKCSQVVPDGYDLTNVVAINVVRTPPGMVASRQRKDATFVPHRKENSADSNGFPVGSEQIIYNKDFNPYTNFHTYTFTVEPEGVAFYIDAPNGGLGVKEPGVIPVQVFTLEDFPSLKFFGPNSPGADIMFNSTRGQTSTLQSPYLLGHLQMILNMNINEEWGGRPGEFKGTETYVRRIAYHPPRQARTLHNMFQAENRREVFEVNFDKWDETDWWSDFRKVFIADQTPFHSVLNVDVAEAPDGLNSLRLRMLRNGYLSGRTFYRLSAPQPTQVVDRNTGKVWASTLHPGQFDVFPYPEGVSQLNVTIIVSAKSGSTHCHYVLNSAGWYLEAMQGNVDQGHACSFLPEANAGLYLTVLPDASVMMELVLLNLGGPNAEPEPMPQPVGEEDPSLDYLTLPSPPPPSDASIAPTSSPVTAPKHILPPKSGVPDGLVPTELPPPPPPPPKEAPAPPPEFPPAPPLPDIPKPAAPQVEAPPAPPAPPA